MRVREHWINGSHPAQGWIAVDGGSHMGWTYSAPYTDADNHGIWTSATNEGVFYPWRELLPYFYLYGNRGNGPYPNAGDAHDGRDSLNDDRSTLCVSAGLFKNRHARWLLDKKAWDRLYDILYEDKAVKPLAPDDPAAPLPLGRLFRRAGVVVARDRWDDRPPSSSSRAHSIPPTITIAWPSSMATISPTPAATPRRPTPPPTCGWRSGTSSTCGRPRGRIP